MKFTEYINDGLKKYAYSKKISFQTPAHKGKLDIMTEDFFGMDMGNLDVIKGMPNPTAYVKMSQNQLARIYGAERSFYLLNGASSGILAALTLCLKQNDMIIVDRNCHKSVINAIILLGLLPIFVEPVYMHRFGFGGGFDYAALERTVSTFPNAKAMLITSPNYYGVVSDVEKITTLAHTNNMFMIVDEAHGAHFNFCDKLPKSAVEYGADFVVQSASKTLGGLNGSAFLHVNCNNFLNKEILAAISMYQTSSASYAAMAVLEKSVFEAENHKERYDKMLSAVAEAADYVNNNSNAYWLDDEITGSADVFAYDKTRIVINFAFSGVSGYDAAQILNSRFDIKVELCDDLNIVCIFTPYNKISDVKKLAKAIVTIAGKTVGIKELSDRPSKGVTHAMKLTPRDAFFAESEAVELKDALGRVSKNIVCKYPPGIPILIPGDVISSEHIKSVLEILDSGAEISGIREDFTIDVVKKRTGDEK